MKAKINVTLNDIKSGIPARPSSCPIARAIRRSKKLGNPTSVVVFGYAVILDFFSDSARIKLPANASVFVMKFDGNKSGPNLPKPFTFVLDTEKVEQ